MHRRAGAGGARGRVIPPQDAAGALEVGGRRDLEAAFVAGHGDDGMSGGLHEGGVVGVIAVGFGHRREEDVAPEALRSLGGGEFGAVDRRDDLLARDTFDGVDDGEHRQHRIASRLERGLHAGEHLGRGEGARGVVHEHELHVGPDGVQSRGDGLLPGVTAGDDRHEVAPRRAVGRRRLRHRLVHLGARIAHPVARHDDDDLRG